MNFRSLFATSKPARRFQGRRSQGLNSTLPVGRLERLEARALLAGNVTAQLFGQTAIVNGDAADNSVQLLIEGGNVVVRGQDGTTINGSTDDFVLASGTTSLAGYLSASLGSGNDTFTIAGVALSRNAAISGGSGNDQIAVMASSAVTGNLTILGGSGADTISVQDSSIGRTVQILAGNGSDTLVVSNANIGRDLMIWGGSNSDNIVVDSTRVERDTRISGQSGNDNIVLRDSVFVDDIVVSGNAGHDIIVFDSSAVGDKSFMFGGGGSDNIQITGTSQFFDRLRTYGGPGRDNIETSAGVTFDGLKRISFSGRVADAAAIETRINNTTSGAIAVAEAAVQAFDPQLSLSVSSASISEGAGNGASTLTITRESNTDSDLEITLTSSAPARLSLRQSSVVIPAGQTTVTVLLDPQNDDVVGNDTVVTLTATANGLNTNSIDVTVTDDDAESLEVSANVSTIAEDTGSASTTGSANSVSYTITRTGDVTAALTVSLAESTANVFDVPATVTIPAGDSSVTVDIPTIVNTTVGNDVTFTLTATATGFASANTSVIVLDNDSEQLSVAFSAPTITETGSDSTATLTVTRNTNTTDAINVTVTSQDPDNLTFSGNSTAELTIPAGANSATISVSGVAENFNEGDLTVAVIASATGFSSGSETIVAVDDDVPTLAIALSGTNVIAENAGTGAVSATISRNTADASTDVIVTLTSTGDSRLSVPASVTIPAGEHFVNVSFDTIDNNIVDVPADGTATVTALASGFVSGTASITITNDDTATISLSPSSLSVSETAGVAGATLTLSRTDSFAPETVTLTYSDTSLLTGPASVDFAAGETTASIALDIIDNNLFADNNAVTVTASATGHADVFTSIGVVNDETLSLTVDTSSNAIVESVGTQITKVAEYTITGQTAPGATVQVDTNGDAAFDEASTVADQNGDYTVNVTLTHDATNDGRNLIQVRSLVVAESVETLSSEFEVQLAIGTVIRFETNQDLDNSGTNDFYDVELLDDDAPVTVANFLSYVTDGSYEKMFIHRSPFNFVIQGGGFKVDNSVVSGVTTKPSIANEFDAANSNTRGTLSMALLSGQPASGTSGWFVNVVDNSFLDANLHTVFGNVIGDGMTVVDAINQLPIFDLNFPLNQSALGETPLSQTPLTQLTGVIALTANSATITGTGTSFTTELQVGNIIQIGNTQLEVLSIASDTELTVDVEASANQSGLLASLFTTPADDDFIIFSNIGEILDAV